MDHISFKSMKSRPQFYKKKSQISKRSFSASSPSLRGPDNTRLTSSASFGNNKYLKNIGMLEFIGSPYLESLNKSQNKIVANYKSPEDYQDEVLALKKKIQELQSEISILKFKVRHREEEIIKKQKLINDSLNSKIAESSSSLDPCTIINNLKLKLAKVQEKYRENESALSKLQKSIKASHVKEMEVTIETLNEEIIRLNSLLSKARNKSPDSAPKQNRKSMSKSVDTRIRDLTSTILKMTSIKNRLLLENKSLKIELQKSHDMKENMKKNFENERKCNNENNIEISSSPNYDPTFVNRSKEKELKSEIGKLKKEIIQMKDEANFYKNKCSFHEDSKTPRNAKHDEKNEPPTTLSLQQINRNRTSNNKSLKQTINESLDHNDLELLQSIFRNHKERHDFLYCNASNKGTIDSDSESLMEAVELIQSVTRNFRKQPINIFKF